MDTNIRDDAGAGKLVFDELGISPYAQSVLATNDIAGLLPLRVRTANNKKQYCYELGRKISLEKYYARRLLSYDELEKIITSLVNLPKQIEEYLLDADYVALSPELIFVDECRQKYEYCLLKTGSKDYFDGVRAIMAFLLRKVDHLDEACVKKAYELFEIVGNDSFYLEDLLSAFSNKEEPSPIAEPFEDDYEIALDMEADEEDGFIQKWNSEGKRIIAEYEVEDDTAPAWLSEKENFFSEKSIKKLIAVMLPALGVVAFACLFALGLMTGLPLWMKIICPGLVMSSLVLAGSAIWPKAPVPLATQ